MAFYLLFGNTNRKFKQKILHCTVCEKKKTLSDSTRLALIIIWKYLCES